VSFVGCRGWREGLLCGGGKREGFGVGELTCWLVRSGVCVRFHRSPGGEGLRESPSATTTAIDVLRRVVNELMAVDLARSRRDDQLCVETVFIIQEAHVQLKSAGQCELTINLDISIVCCTHLLLPLVLSYGINSTAPRTIITCAHHHTILETWRRSHNEQGTNPTIHRYAQHITHLRGL
jgi:hypothetical protein